MTSSNLNSSFIFKSFKILQQFSSVKRYSRDRLICPENDLEHTGFVALISYFLALEVRKLGVEINLEKLLVGAIVHDIDEALTGDVPRPTKHNNNSLLEEIKRLEFNSVKTIFEYLDQENSQNNIVKDWEDAKKDGTIEGDIVKLADTLSVVYKVWVEVVLMSNRSFLIVAEEIKQALEFQLEKLENTAYSPKNIEYGLWLCNTYEDSLSIVLECISSAAGVYPLIPLPIEIKR